MKIFFLAENEIFYDIIVEIIEEIICQTDKYNPCTNLHTLHTHLPPLENTLKERFLGPVTFQTFDQRDEET